MIFFVRPLPFIHLLSVVFTRSPSDVFVLVRARVPSVVLFISVALCFSCYPSLLLARLSVYIPWVCIFTL